MSDDSGEPLVHPADAPKPLQDFVGQFQTDAQGVFGDAAVRLQDYLMQRQIVDRAAAAGDLLMSNINQFRNGMVGMAQADPGAVGLGLNVVPDIIHGLVSANPFLPDEHKATVASDLTTNIQREIARAGVMTLADRDADTARGLLGHEKVADLLGEADTRDLHGYIDAMAGARDTDATAQARQQDQDRRQARDHSLLQYASALVDPTTSDVQFPPGWAQRVMKDQAVSPTDTANMMTLYKRLQEGGDPPVSNAFAMADLIAVANAGGGSVDQALQAAGTDLKTADALNLAGMMTPKSPEAKRELEALHTTIQAYKRQIVTPENGVAGEAAFGRFMNWLIPAYRDAGMGSLDPKAENSIIPTQANSNYDQDSNASFARLFAPRTDDLVIGALPYQRSLDELRARNPDAMSLENIFGRRAQGSSGGDQVIYAPRIYAPQTPIQNLSPAGTVGSGNPQDLPQEGPPEYYNPEIKT